MTSPRFASLVRGHPKRSHHAPMSTTASALPTPEANDPTRPVTISNLQIAHRLVEQANVLENVADAQVILDQLADVIFIALSEGQGVNLKNIGTFSVERIEGRKNNLRPGEVCPPKTRGRFHLARYLQDGY